MSPDKPNLHGNKLREYLIESGSADESEGFGLITKITINDDIKNRNVIQSMKKYEELFKKLWLVTRSLMKNEKSLTKKSRSIKQCILGERIALEKCKLQYEEDLEIISSLDQERMEAQIKVDKAERLNTMVLYELQRLEEVGNDIVEKLEEMKKTNAQNVGPELDRLRSTLYAIRDDHDTTIEAIQEEEKSFKNLYCRLQEITVSQVDLQKTRTSKKELYHEIKIESKEKKAQTNPISEQLDKVKLDLALINERIVFLEKNTLEEQKKKIEAHRIKSVLQERHKQQQIVNDQKERDNDLVSKKLNLATIEHHNIVTRRLEIELSLKKVDEDKRHKKTASLLESKQLDALKRTYLKKAHMTKATEDLILQLNVKLTESNHLLSTWKEKNESQQNFATDMKEKVGISIIRFIDHENNEKLYENDLNCIVGKVEKKELEIQQCLAQEKKMSKIIQIKSARCDLQERESMRCSQNIKDLNEKITLKEFVKLDLVKKLDETKSSLKDYRALYDHIQKDRNNHYGMTESAEKVRAGMKEKLSLKYNELNMLQEDVVQKETILSKECDSHENSMSQCAVLRADYFKVRHNSNLLKDKIESQKASAFKLMSSIRASKREKSKQQSQNRRIGVVINNTKHQLTARKTEIHCLEEKLKAYEQTLKIGEKVMQNADDDYQILKLHHEDILRCMENANKKLPKISEFKEKICDLNCKLDMERAVTKKLCQDLENPKNTDRWREVGDIIPDEDLLRAKMTILGQRWSDNKELLMEKELVLEEVTSLTEALKKRGDSEKLRVQSIAQINNAFQIKARDINRRMMAVVSELSMYQATTTKLEEEKRRRELWLESSRITFQKGEAPSDEAMREFDRLRNKYLSMITSPSRNSESRNKKFYSSINSKRTTAEPRPTAYIPDNDGIGLPKPYGGMAPFKPVIPGSTMRHIRAPESQHIQI